MAVLAIVGTIAYCLSRKMPGRCAVFAGYNPNGTIPAYVITYLKALNEIAPKCVVYIADSTLNPAEKEKLKNLTLHTEHIRHEEYDWGSYKRGFNWLKENGYLKNLNELIFANDSCYAPLGGTFKPMFDEMSHRPELDFWGDSQNIAFNPHIQSYFMVFRKRVINSRSFSAFLNRVTHQPFQFYYIRFYEIALTPELASIGYKWDSFIDYKNFPIRNNDPDINTAPLTAIKDFNHLFLKRRTFTSGLPIWESIPELLRYLAKKYPSSYKEIIAEIPPHFIPDDLKE